MTNFLAAFLGFVYLRHVELEEEENFLMFDTLVESVIHLFSNLLSKEGIVFVTSMMPILELRGGVVVGYSLGLDLMTTSLISVLGNLLPIPFILFFY